MGYTTEFNGRFEINKPVDDKTAAILEGLATTRRMKRNVDESIYGIEGEFYFEDDDAYTFPRPKNTNIIDYNKPPVTQPWLWCQWELTHDKQGLQWDGNEKFYMYVEWLQYIIERVLAPKGYRLDGTVEWFGEDPDDRGIIIVQNNIVSTKIGRIVYE